MRMTVTRSGRSTKLFCMPVKPGCGMKLVICGLSPIENGRKPQELSFSVLPSWFMASPYVTTLSDSRCSIIMDTVFRFRRIDINGLLLIITNQGTIEWLRKALHEFMEAYE